MNDCRNCDKNSNCKDYIKGYTKLHCKKWKEIDLSNPVTWKYNMLTLKKGETKTVFNETYTFADKI